MYKNKQVRMIFAQTLNRVIGINGTLPWYCPADMKIFRGLTHGCCVIMGRKTWESLPERNRPLKGRMNIVISRTEGYVAEGATVYKSLEEALDHAPEPIVIIGGGELYSQAMQWADEISVSQMAIALMTNQYKVEELTFAPQIDESVFGMDTVLDYASEVVDLPSGGKYTTPAFHHVTYRRLPKNSMPDSMRSHVLG